MTEEQERELLDAATEELRNVSLPFTVTLTMDLQTTLSIAAAVQLANRHPAVPAEHKERTAAFIQGVILTFESLNMPAHVALVKSGEPDQEEAPPPSIQ